MNISKRFGLLVGVATIVATLGVQMTPAAAQTASISVTAGGGTLAFTSAPPTFAFSGVTSGAVAVTSTASELFDVTDTTGSGSGWNVQITGANLVNGGNTLAPSRVTVSGAPVWACDAVSSCTVPTGSGISYAPWTLSGSAQKFLNATAGTGMGTQKTTPTFNLVIPGGTPGGTYSATWTISLTSGP